MCRSLLHPPAQAAGNVSFLRKQLLLEQATGFSTVQVLTHSRFADNSGCGEQQLLPGMLGSDSHRLLPPHFRGVVVSRHSSCQAPEEWIQVRLFLGL